MADVIKSYLESLGYGACMKDGWPEARHKP